MILEKMEINYKTLLNEIVKEGKILIYPTDTVYGLGGTIDNIEALERIYEVKGRDVRSPLIALISFKEKLDEIVIINKLNRKKIELLINNFWPGGLTIIFQKKDIIPPNMVSNGTSVGVRIPDHELSIKIIESCGGILATTSANISGEPSPKSYGELSKKIKSKVDIIIKDVGVLKGKESTIIDMRITPKILREGHISRIEIEKIIGKVE